MLKRMTHLPKKQKLTVNSLFSSPVNFEPHWAPSACKHMAVPTAMFLWQTAFRTRASQCSRIGNGSCASLLSTLNSDFSGADDDSLVSCFLQQIRTTSRVRVNMFGETCCVFNALRGSGGRQNTIRNRTGNDLTS